MSGYVPKVGDRVRITIVHEGEVTRVGDAGGLDVAGMGWGLNLDDPRLKVTCINLDVVADKIVPKYLPFIPGGRGRVNAVKELRGLTGCTLPDGIAAVDRATERASR